MLLDLTGKAWVGAGDFAFLTSSQVVHGGLHSANHWLKLCGMLLQELLEETLAPKFILYGEKLLIHLTD